MAGDVIMYTADDQNIHSVDEITEGERITLTLWFSRDASFDEDPKLISSLSPALLGVADGKLHSYIPVPGSINMYWFPPDEASSFLSGFDIRCGRLHVLGFDIYPFQETFHLSKSESSYNILELLSGPLLLARESKLLDTQFLNIMHALQMVQFYIWKFFNLKIKVEGTTLNVTPTSQTQKTDIDHLKSVFLKDVQLAERFFGHSRSIKDVATYEFDWFTFSAAIPEWECYVLKLQKELLLHLPHWRTNQSIFCVPLGGDLED